MHPRTQQIFDSRPDHHQSVSADLADIWAEVRGSIVERLVTLESAVAAVLGSTANDAIIENAGREAHRLKGSLGTFGLSEGSRIASSLEELLVDVRSATDHVSVLAEGVYLLRLAIERFEPIRNQSESSSTSPLNDVARILLASNDPRIAKDILSGLPNGTITFPIHTTFQRSSSDVICVHIPDAGGVDSVDHLLRLPGRKLVIASGLGLDDRLRLLDSGVERIIDGSKTAKEIAKEISEALAPYGASNGTIVAVDDDSEMLAILKEKISPFVGTFVCTTKSTELWAILKQHHADLLILDYDMPGVTGLDLIRAIRSDRTFDYMAVIVLSAIEDTDIVQRIYAAGADDCVKKPLTIGDMTSRVLMRLHRSGLAQRGQYSPENPVHEDASPHRVGYTTDIAFVDDDVVVTELLEEAMRRLGYSTTTLPDGETAIDSLGGEHPTVVPRLILLDVDMPGVNGLSVLRRIKVDRVLARTKVIMLTGRATESETLEALKIGAIDHVPKPFNLQLLVEKVRQALAPK